MSRLDYWIFQTWLVFAIRYRKTIFGPVWLLIGPLLFILAIGVLYSYVNGVVIETFVPNLTVGLIVWTLINGFVTGSTTVFQRGRAQILQGGVIHVDVIMVEVFTTVLYFLHQIILIVGVFLFFGLGVSFVELAISLIGLALLIVNGVWLTQVFGIIGARFRDLTEIVQAIMRIAFLATPIIWMPGVGQRADVMQVFLLFNPFYHFLEIIRAPLLGNAISIESWLIVSAITLGGFSLAYFFQVRYARNIPLWI